MSAVLVDTNVLLDIATRDPTWEEWSAKAIEDCASRSLLVINPIIYAEVSIGYVRIEDLDAALPAEIYKRESLPFEAAFLAGQCDALVKCNAGEPKESRRRVVETRLASTALEGDVDGVRHLRRELVERECRDEAEHAVWDPKRDRRGLPRVAGPRTSVSSRHGA